MISTIYAPATPPARSAIAVIRISGPETGRAVIALAGALPPPRRASLRTLRFEQRELDQALVLWMPGPASFTGDDTAELHVHGGPAVIAAVAEALSDLGLALAEPGAFTRRALENGRLDLAEAEGLADLIDAETEAQRAQALDQLGGALTRRHEAWRDLAVEALAYLEAAIDFPDEDLPEDVAGRAAPPLQKLLREVKSALSASPAGEVIRDGYRIALLGAPNAGKSSLLNALTGRDAAIVTDIPGTTRDVIEVPIDLRGFRIILADTAGLRDTHDPVEAEGVRRARAWAEAAHLRIWLTEQRTLGFAPAEFRAGDLHVFSKADLQPAPPGSLSVSVTAEGGLNQLQAAIVGRVSTATSTTHFPAITRSRHRSALQQAAERLAFAIDQLGSPELAAEDVRLALQALSEVTGHVTSEVVLDRLFSSFCIGK